MEIDWVLTYGIISSVFAPILLLWWDHRNLDNGVNVGLLIGCFVFGIFALPLIGVMILSLHLGEINVHWPFGKKK